MMYYALIIVCALELDHPCDVEHATWISESEPNFLSSELCFKGAEDYVTDVFDNTWPHQTIIVCTEASVSAT
jgi:hypothetical protein